MVYQKCITAILRELKESLLEVDLEQLELLIDEILAAKRIFCDGNGRSGLQADSFAMRLSQMGLVSYVVSEMTTPSIRREDLLLICSGSGETSSLLDHAKRAAAVGAKIILITAKDESSIGKISTGQVLIKAPIKNEDDDDSIQPMGTLFEQSSGILLDTVVLFLMKRLQISSEDMFRNHKNLE